MRSDFRASILALVFVFVSGLCRAAPWQKNDTLDRRVYPPSSLKMVNVHGKGITQDIGVTSVTEVRPIKTRVVTFFKHVANDLNVAVTNPAFYQDKFFIEKPTGADEMMFFVFEAGPKCPPENPCYGWIAMQARTRTTEGRALHGGIWGTKGGVLEHLIAKKVPKDTYGPQEEQWDALDKKFQEIVGGWEIPEAKAVWVKDHPDSEYVKTLGKKIWTSREGEALIDKAIEKSEKSLGLAAGWTYCKKEPILSKQPFPGLLHSEGEYFCKAKVFVGKKQFLITVNARDPALNNVQCIVLC